MNQGISNNETHLEWCGLRGYLIAPEGNKLLDAEKAHCEMTDVRDAVVLAHLKNIRAKE
jgi:hypothetical protein